MKIVATRLAASLATCSLIFVFAVLMAFPVKWIVNYLISPSALVTVFGIGHLTLWKAFWLSFLCSTLFKGSNTVSK